MKILEIYKKIFKLEKNRIYEGYEKEKEKIIHSFQKDESYNIKVNDFFLDGYGIVFDVEYEKKQLEVTIEPTFSENGYSVEFTKNLSDKKLTAFDQIVVQDFFLHRLLSNETKWKTIDIVGKEWFDKVNGNTYCSVQVTFDYRLETHKTYYIPMKYGDYEQTAYEFLVENEIIPKQKSYGIWPFCQKYGLILRSYCYRNCTKKETQAFGKE